MKDRQESGGRRDCLFDLVRWRDLIVKAATTALANGDFERGDQRASPAEAILHLAVEMAASAAVFEAMMTSGLSGRDARAMEDLRRIALFLTHRFPEAACTEPEARLAVVVDWRQLAVKVYEIFDRWVELIGANLPPDRRIAAFVSPYFGPLTLHESVRLQLIHARLHLA